MPNQLLKLFSAYLRVEFEQKIRLWAVYNILLQNSCLTVTLGHLALQFTQCFLLSAAPHEVELSVILSHTAVWCTSVHSANGSERNPYFTSLQGTFKFSFTLQ